jgi:predicted dehydrogenase
MNKVRWGLIGCGDIARKRVVPALKNSENSELIAISRANFLLAESFAKEFGIQNYYRYWQDMIKDNDIDAVYIATPVYLHIMQTVEAAFAGKHILCEKPMALNVHECEKMVEASLKNNVKLGVAYYRHFYPVIQKVKEILLSGEIGEPKIVEMNAYEWFDRRPGDPRYWLLEKRKSGGGVMMDFGCHRIEVLQSIFGKIINIQSQIFNLHFKREVEDTAYVSLLFENEVQAILKVSNVVYEPKDTLIIYGTSGTIRIPVLNTGKITIFSKDGTRDEEFRPHQNLHQPLIEDFAQAVLDNREPAVNGTAGKEVSVVLEEIYEQEALSRLFNRNK